MVSVVSDNRFKKMRWHRVPSPEIKLFRAIPHNCYDTHYRAAIL